MQPAKRIWAVLLAAFMIPGVFAIPAGAQSEDNPSGYYDLTKNGAPYGMYPAGGTVTLVTGFGLSDGSRFLRWDFTPEVAFANGTDATSAEVTFIMPACAVAVESVYSAPAPDVFYPVTVIGGMCAGTYYAAGEVVTITAYPPLGRIYRFMRWDVYPEVTFTEDTSAASPAAKFIMPAGGVSVVANYESIPPKWWESPPLPLWQHLALRWLCFGWIWMR